MKKLFSVVICLCLLIPSITAITAQDSDDLTPSRGRFGYLSEEEVFDALAFTYGDAKLTGRITSARRVGPDGFVNEGFHAEDYAAYTDGQYGGMYLNADGALVLCYVENSDAFKKAKKLNDANSRLLDSSKGVLVSKVIIKGVKHSYNELLSACRRLDEVIDKKSDKKGIYQWWVDGENNRIVVEMSPDERLDKVEAELAALFDDDMLFFIRKEQEEMKFIATINGTSAINNGFSETTPAGRMFSSRRGTYGIITCAHGYSF